MADKDRPHVHLPGLQLNIQYPKSEKARKGFLAFFGVSSTVVRAARGLGFGNTSLGLLDCVAQDLQLFPAEEYFFDVLMVGRGRILLVLLVQNLLLV
ncbi:hypothetical protein [Pseudomonas khavaziana]|uniref:hypothetical protein n=1 Tax=Pseudomonas khavaziana TaxID=2842351 RepID=UPI001C3C3D3F|nr:hypothetical protein [Pseudomonas khavaziana]MBV4480766.1 hypothetical protein [Pseudomonas khavaziana]